MIVKTLFTTLIFAAFSAAVNGTGAQKKGGMLVGGKTDFDVKDVPPEVLDAAVQKFESSRDKIEGISNSMYKLTKPVVVGVQTQIVSGTMYHFTVLAGQSTCRKGEEVDVSTCSMDTEPLRKPLVECTVRVWSRPWLESTPLEAQEINASKDCGQPETMKPDGTN